MVYPGSLAYFLLPVPGPDLSSEPLFSHIVPTGWGGDLAETLVERPKLSLSYDDVALKELNAKPHQGSQRSFLEEGLIEPWSSRVLTFAEDKYGNLGRWWNQQGQTLGILREGLGWPMRSLSDRG